MRLWPHQDRSRRVCVEAHQAKRSRVLVQLPPGTGKTEVAIQAGFDWLRAHTFGRVLICVSSVPVLSQFHRRLEAATVMPVHVEQAARQAARNARLVLATQQTLWNRLDKYASNTLLIFDECHHGNLDAEENLSLVSRFDHVVGLSATPWSRGCTRLFAGSASSFLSLSGAIAEKMVAPYEVADWTAPTGPFGLVFCASNAECARRAAGHPGSSWVGVDSGYVPERIAAWKRARLPVLYANRMLLEGFDEPRCAEVWITRDSDSDIAYVQMAGRALRFQVGKVARIHCETSTIRDAVGHALARADKPPLFLVP